MSGIVLNTKLLAVYSFTSLTVDQINRYLPNCKDDPTDGILDIFKNYPE